MLAVDIDQKESDCFQVCQRDRGTVYAGRAAVGCDTPGYDDLVFLSWDPQVLHGMKDFFIRRGKDKFYQSVIGTGPDKRFACFIAEGNRNRTDNDRFSCAGLSGKYIQPLFKIDICFPDQGQIFQMDVFQHDPGNPPAKSLSAGSGSWRSVKRRLHQNGRHT